MTDKPRIRLYGDEAWVCVKRPDGKWYPVYGTHSRDGRHVTAGEAARHFAAYWPAFRFVASL